MTNEIRHNFTVDQLKKMNDNRLMKVFVSVMNRTPSELMSDRQSLILVLAVYGPEQFSEDEEIANAKNFKATQARLNKLISAEKKAAIVGWKRDGIRRWRKFGASWNEIASEFGVSTNTASAIANNKIYKWDNDTNAIISLPGEKVNFGKMMEQVGMVKHEEHDLDRFFA